MLNFNKVIRLHKVLQNAVKADLNAKGKSNLYNTFEQFSFNIRRIHRFMISDRYDNKKSNPVSKLRKGTQFILGIEERKKITYPKPSDVLNFIKSLEVFALQLATNPKFDYHSLELDLSTMCDFEEEANSIVNDLKRIILDLRIENHILSDLEKTRLLSCVFSYITVYRNYHLKKIPSDYTTISKPYSGDLTIQEVIQKHFTAEKIENFFSQFDFSRLDPETKKAVIYSSNKNGPSTGHSDLSHFRDLLALSKEPELFSSVRELISCFENGDQILEYADTLLLNVKEDESDSNPEQGGLHSRLAAFTAPGGKKRIVGVVDWLTQSACLPIHRTLMELLKQLDSDRTFNHKADLSFFNNIKDDVISVDLSAATDRLPIELQSILISEVFKRVGLDGDRISKSWVSSLNRDFSSRGTDFFDKAPLLRYTCGQAMGILASFSSMSLLHHYLIFISNDGLAKPVYTSIGDDAILVGNKVFSNYSRILKDIGVDQNAKKTIYSRQKEGIFHTFEFARNYVIYGCRLSLISTGKAIRVSEGSLTASDLIQDILPLMSKPLLHSLRESDLLADTTTDELIILAIFLGTNKSMPVTFTFKECKKLFEDLTSEKFFSESIFENAKKLIERDANRVINIEGIKNPAKIGELIRTRMIVKSTQSDRKKLIHQYFSLLTYLDGITGSIAAEKFIRFSLSTVDDDLERENISPFLRPSTKKDIIQAYTEFSKEEKFRKSDEIV